MNRSRLLSIVIALALVAAALAGAWAVLRPAGPPLVAAALDRPALSPNADGDDDVAHLSYTLRRPASVSIYFQDAAEQRFYFRQDKARDAGEYQVEFAGVVDAFSLPTDNFADFSGRVLRRGLPNGQYTWHVAATDAAGATNELSGALTISGADAALPLIVNFGVSPTLFSPNRDGIDDRATITLALTKDIAPDGLRVYLIAPDGTQLSIEEQPGNRQPGQAGLHSFDYDAGIDQGLTPPADGAYTVLAEAEDALGQRVQVTTQLAIAHGGLPRAEIVLGEVRWSASSVVVGHFLTFTLVVENYGTAPLRTTGPAPGYVYASMLTNSNALGAYEESGAWRIGLMCQTCKSDYPWRWALGSPESLTLIRDSNDRPQYYLMPGQTAVVTGGVALDEVVPSLNPQYFWAGLIHENVAVVNNRIGQNLVTILAP
ncbi:MAG: hypothetical protein IT317_07700 [Anaerolineales bacterium]|nr:hypothetical protein [Anaerolineales bacterium]